MQKKKKKGRKGKKEKDGKKEKKSYVTAVLEILFHHCQMWRGGHFCSGLHPILLFN